MLDIGLVTCGWTFATFPIRRCQNYFIKKSCPFQSIPRYRQTRGISRYYLVTSSSQFAPTVDKNYQWQYLVRRTYTRFAIFVPVPYKRVKNDVLDYISWTLTVNVRLWIISVPQFFLDSELNSFDFSLLLVSFNVGSYQGKEATTISTSSSSLPDLLHHIPSLQMKCMQPPRHTARPKRFRNPPNIEIHHSLFLLLANTKQPRFL